MVKQLRSASIIVGCHNRGFISRLTAREAFRKGMGSDLSRSKDDAAFDQFNSIISSPKRVVAKRRKMVENA